MCQNVLHDEANQTNVESGNASRVFALTLLTSKVTISVILCVVPQLLLVNVKSQQLIVKEVILVSVI